MANNHAIIWFLSILKSFFTKLILSVAIFLIFVGDIVRLLINIAITKLTYSIYTIARIFKLTGDGVVYIVKLLAKIRLPNPTKIVSSTIPFKIRYFIFGILVACSIFAFYRAKQFVTALPNPRLIGSVNYPVSSKIFDRNETLLYEMYQDENRTPVKLNDIPQTLREATIAVEDKDFYKHNGISFYGGILRAVKEMVVTHNLEGGSTITQQLVKTALLTPERTIERKVKEALLAIWVERVYSKDQILEMYFNQVSYGGSAYGVEEAAKTYFGKEVSEVTLDEAAFLAGLPQAPSYYSPYSNPKLAQQRRNEVLRQMREEGYISDEEYSQAVSTSLVVKEPKDIIKAPHFVFYVKSLIEKKYGTRRVEEGGLRIYTSLDLSVQENAENILNDEISKIQQYQVTNGAVLVTIPSTGEILAMVGSKDYFSTPYGAFNVTTAPRQPGSSIKPLMYSLALEKNYTAASVIEDAPVVFTGRGSKPFQPVNYDGRYHGRVTLRYALANSYNIPAVKVLNTLGVDNFIDHAESMGITTWGDRSRFGLSLTLGGGEVTMVDMATAYGVFANAGERVDLNPILKIEDYQGNLIYSPGSDFYKQPKMVVSNYIAYIISSILSDSQARTPAFGTNSQLDIPGYTVAVKTGTTNNKRDNWTIGYTPRYLTTIWVGNNDNSPMNKEIVSGLTGASPVWNRVMSMVLKTNVKPSKTEDVSNSFTKPAGIIEKQCYFGNVEYFVPGTETLSGCNEPLFSLTPTLTPAAATPIAYPTKVLR